jgi:hypothetical protein
MKVFFILIIILIIQSPANIYGQSLIDLMDSTIYNFKQENYEDAVYWAKKVLITLEKENSKYDST